MRDPIYEINITVNRRSTYGKRMTPREKRPAIDSMKSSRKEVYIGACFCFIQTVTCLHRLLITLWLEFDDCLRLQNIAEHYFEVLLVQGLEVIYTYFSYLEKNKPKITL